MHYYEVAIKGYYLDALTYESDEKITLFSEVLVPLGRGEKSVKAIILKEVSKPEFPTKSVLEISQKKLSPEQFELAKFISSYYTCKFSFIVGAFECAKPYMPKPVEIINAPKLSDKQLEAFDFAKKHDTSLLFADTGSGKTEIYISLIKERLKKGEQTLLLMPEIALTPQMQRRLEVYFKGHFAMWHSKITKVQKRKILERLENGEILLIAGARSALYLPFSTLSLIIVDEEHDNSYKASDMPRINARDLALFLGRKLNIQVLLGSATPSLTSFHKQPTFRLKGTFFKSEKEFIYDDGEGISSTLLREIRTSLRAKKQAIIFLPTRANFRQVLCQSCGGTIKCPFCSVAMSLHKKKNALKCHYCGFMQRIPQNCPSCNGAILEAKKMGTAELTERLYTELGVEFKSVKIAQFDSDSLNTQKKLVSILSDFNEGKIDILVGTSMLAKGHDYHNVDLSVILGLDEYLYRPNFRAKEETLTLAMQVAGRAGRKGVARVLCQTRQKAFFSRFIRDYDAFLQEELNERKGLYPPFTRLLRLLIEDKNQNTARQICEDLAAKIKGFSVNLKPFESENLGEIRVNLNSQREIKSNSQAEFSSNSVGEIQANLNSKSEISLNSNSQPEFSPNSASKIQPRLEFVGHGACGIELMGGKFRFYILLRSTDYKVLLRVAKFALNFNDKITTDIDPIDFA